MSDSYATLENQLLLAWQQASADLACPGLVAVACEDGQLVRAAVTHLANSEGIDCDLLTTPPLNAVLPFEPLLGWWQAQGTTAQRQQAVQRHISYLPLRQQLEALANGDAPDGDKLPLLDDRHFEYQSLLHGLATLVADASVVGRVVLIKQLELAGPSLLDLLRRLAATPTAAPLLIVIQVATHRCLSDNRFEADWEQFFDWIDSRHALVSVEGLAMPSPPASWPEVGVCLSRLKRARVLLAFAEVVAAARELLEEQAISWPASQQHELQLYYAESLLDLNQVDDALAVLEALTHELELTADLSRQCLVQRLLSYCYQQRQDFESAQQAARQSIALAEKLGDELQLAKGLFAFYYLHDKSTTPIGLDQFQQLTALLERHNLTNALIYCLRNYYVFLRFSDQVSVSDVLKVSRQAIRLARARGHRAQLAAAFQSRGILHSYRHEYFAMFRCFNISETLRSELGDQLDLVRIRNGIGYFHTLLEQYGQAMKYYARAFAVVRRERDYSEVLVTLFNIAWLYMLTRHYERAIELVDQLLAICRARRLTHFPFRNLYDVYTLKGFCHVKLGELAQAAQCIERMRVLTFQPSPSGEFLRALLRGSLAMAQRDFVQAREIFEAAPEYLGGQLDIDNRMLPLCYLELAQLMCRQGQRGEAVSYLQQALQLCSAMMMLVSYQRIHEALLRLEEGGDPDIDLPPERLQAVNLALDDLVTMAVQQTRLDDARKRLREVNLLSRLQRMVDQYESMESLAQATLRFVAANLSAHAAAIFRQHEGEWLLLASFGDELEARQLASQIVRLEEQSTVLVENRLHREGEIGTRATYRSLVALPLMEEGKLAGALLLTTLDSSRYFDRHDREVLSLLAAQLAAQCAQIAHRERLVRMSTTDVLTGLANRQALQARLREEMVTATGHSARCSLAFIDLDNFKYINDSYGHDVGDEVLKAFAQLLRSGLRDMDLAARWGGDEFVILFPATPATNARRVADRLLQALEANGHFAPLLSTLIGKPVRFPPGKALGCSIGIAEAETGLLAVDDQELLRRADSALYQAKGDGKGQVALWPLAVVAGGG